MPYRSLAAVPTALWFLGLLQPGATTNPIRPDPEPDSVLWERTAHVALQQELWSDESSYDAAHFLMVPLHAAFEQKQTAWQQDFAAHFARFVPAGFPEGASEGNRLAREQYAYLASRYLVLSAGTPGSPPVPNGLAELLDREVSQAWVGDSFTQWKRHYSGLKESVLSKLKDPKPGYRYAIVDRDKFIFALAADLRAYETLTGQKLPHSATWTEILDVADKTFHQRVVPQPGGGWLFQPGYFSDHPDYKYAGVTAKGTDLTPSPVPDLGENTSHSFRFPLLLTSLADAYPAGSPLRQYYLQLRTDLSRQFFGVVLVKPTQEFPGYRVNNYMDGRNGLYRWGYKTMGPDNGYGPYEESGSITLGWWAFLRTPESQALYADLASQFPLQPAVLNLYARGRPTGTSTNPKRLFTAESFVNGTRQLIVDLAAHLQLPVQS